MNRLLGKFVEILCLFVIKGGNALLHVGCWLMASSFLG